MRSVCGDTERSLVGWLLVNHLLGNAEARSWAKEFESYYTKMRKGMKGGATTTLTWNHITNNKIANSLINKIDQRRINRRNQKSKQILDGSPKVKHIGQEHRHDNYKNKGLEIRSPSDHQP